MFSDQHRDNLLTAVALAEFSYHHEKDSPRLAERSWQLAVSRLATYDIDPYEAIDALRAADRHETVTKLEIDRSL